MIQHQKRFLQFRILTVFFIGVIFFLVILFRAFQLQLLPNRKLGELASRQYKASLTLFSKRGTIYDRNLIELAISRKVGSVFANPKNIQNRNKVAQALAKVTGISAVELLKKIKTKKSFVWIKRLVKDSVTQHIQDHPIDGVGIVYEYERYYGQQDLAGQVLGRTGVDSQGVDGLEYQYDGILQGEKKSFALLRDARGRIVTLDETLAMESQEGDSLVLTIDKNLQFLVERELALQVEKVGALGGWAIVQNARTGEILSMANVPLYNPNRSFDPLTDIWKNRAVTELFEPGSTFKVFLSASALENGVLPSQKFYCENGQFRLNKKDVIREAQHHKYEWLTFSDIVKFSSNIGASKIGLQLGRESFYKKINEFGFGKKTGIDLPGEASGIMKPLRDWGKVELSNISFGQGISVTAIQLVTAMSAIANGGKLLKPYIVQKIMNGKTAQVTETKPKEQGMVLSSGDLEKLTKILMATTDAGGTGFLAAMPEYKVAGKTGTAQKLNFKLGTYFKDKHLTSFLGFFPADAKKDEPVYTILVVIDNPIRIPYASYVAAPVFKAVAYHTVRFFPFEKQRVESVPSPDSIAGGTQMLGNSDRQGKAWQQNMSLDIMPSLKGRSMREVLEFAQRAGLLIKTHGSGVVTEQSIKAGTAIIQGKLCTVTLRSPAQVGR